MVRRALIGRRDSKQRRLTERTPVEHYRQGKLRRNRPDQARPSSRGCVSHPIVHPRREPRRHAELREPLCAQEAPDRRPAPVQGRFERLSENVRRNVPGWTDHRVEVQLLHALQDNLLNGEPQQPAVGIVHGHRAVRVFRPGRGPAAGIGTSIGKGLRLVVQILDALDIRIASLPEVQLERVSGLADRPGRPEVAEAESAGRQ